MTFATYSPAAWLGHSTRVADKHYGQVTDADFANALRGTALKTAQQAHATGRSVAHEGRQPHAIAEKCEGLRLSETNYVGDDGLEPPTPSV